MFSRIIANFRYRFLLSKVKPEIIGYKDVTGQRVNSSGASNMTHISNRKNVEIGEHVFIGHFNYIDGFKNVKIGKGCQVTNYVSILTHSSHHTVRFPGFEDSEGFENHAVMTSGPVSIGEYSYIGPHVVIMPGTKIGKGCIISAYSYVKGNIPDFSIVRGIPAKIVGDTRTSDEALMQQYPELSKYYFNPGK